MHSILFDRTGKLVNKNRLSGELDSIDMGPPMRITPFSLIKSSLRIKLLVCFFSALNVSGHSWYSVFST